MKWPLAVMCIACVVGRAHAQHFAPSAPSGAERGAFGALEDAEPAASGALELAAEQARWWGLPELQTRALAVGVGARSLRFASGLSQTGDAELGFTAVAFACGVASHEAGAGVRAASWLDRGADWSVTRAGSNEAAYELGAGAWLMPAAGVRVWASAPQLVVQGTPPLARALELGVRMGGEDAVWCVLRAPRAGDDGERTLGAALAIAPLSLWIELRDAPLRGATGVALRVHGLAVALRLDEHPVLGETVRTSVAWSFAGGGS